MMCGGIACSLGAASGQRSSAMLFNLGRVISYGLAGVLVSGSLQLLISLSYTRSALIVLQWLAAAMLILLGLSIGQWWQGIKRVEVLGEGLWRRFRPIASRYLPIQKPSHALAVGLLWGWLPCGLVYSMLTWSASQADWIEGGLLMVAFGLGTSLSMMALSWFGERAITRLNSSRLRQLGGCVMILFGLWQMLNLGSILTLGNRLNMG
jgi:sulfite exporter TauE/SafE